MKKKITCERGDIIKVPLDSSNHTYGRILSKSEIIFYDCLSSEDRADFQKIIASDILFIAYVSTFFIEDGTWAIVAKVPFDKNELIPTPRYFNMSPQRVEIRNFYEVYKDEILESVKKNWIKTGKSQLGGILSEVRVLERLKNFYDGKKNETNQRMFEDFLKMYTLLKSDNSKIKPM